MRYLRCAVVMVTVVAASSGGTAVAAGRPASGFGRPGAPGSSGFTVTLLTGDRVDVTERAGGRVTTAVRPAPGREKIGFIARGGGLDAEVLPADAGPVGRRRPARPSAVPGPAARPGRIRRRPHRR